LLFPVSFNLRDPKEGGTGVSVGVTLQKSGSISPAPKRETSINVRDGLFHHRQMFARGTPNQNFERIGRVKIAIGTLEKRD